MGRYALCIDCAFKLDSIAATAVRVAIEDASKPKTTRKTHLTKHFQNPTGPMCDTKGFCLMVGPDQEEQVTCKRCIHLRNEGMMVQE